MTTLSGKIALVTGGSRGIGRAIALRLARDGAAVAVHYGRNREAADAAVREIEAAGGTAFAIGADLGTLAGVHALYAALDPALIQHVGEARFDILVNNAGIAPDDTSVGGTDEATFDEVFNLNVKAAFFLTQEALPRLRDGGRIINLTSASTRFAYPQVAAYAMSKGALKTLTLELAKQLGPRGITVNGLSPGLIDTDMTAGMLSDPAARQFAEGVSALGRVGRVDDVADIAAFLASDDARWVTGQDLDASGGTYL
jgi:NAD(P)-dependent dehydrogenase (short-subunit alcohol dehydrogenase family)